MAETTRQFCTFWISSRLFGVDILDVKEVSGDLAVTPVFHAAPSVKGYINVRGQIHLVVDLRRFFGLEEDKAAVAGRVVLFKPAIDEPFGILVDRVGDVVRVEQGRVEERRRKGDGFAGAERRQLAPELTAGVCKLDAGLMVILNARAIPAAVEAQER